MYIYIYIYILICTYLYFLVLLLVFSCYLYAPGSKRVTQFQFSVCMYGTCGKIDNKLTLTFDFDTQRGFNHILMNIISFITGDPLETCLG